MAEGALPAALPGRDEKLRSTTCVGVVANHSIRMPAGAATAAQVEASSAGVGGWAADSGECHACGPPREGVEEDEKQQPEPEPEPVATDNNNQAAQGEASDSRRESFLVAGDDLTPSLKEWRDKNKKEVQEEVVKKIRLEQQQQQQATEIEELNKKLGEEKDRVAKLQDELGEARRQLKEQRERMDNEHEELAELLNASQEQVEAWLEEGPKEALAARLLVQDWVSASDDSLRNSDAPPPAFTRPIIEGDAPDLVEDGPEAELCQLRFGLAMTLLTSNVTTNDNETRRLMHGLKNSLDSLHNPCWTASKTLTRRHVGELLRLLVTKLVARRDEAQIEVSCVRHHDETLEETVNGALAFINNQSPECPVKKTYYELLVKMPNGRRFNVDKRFSDFDHLRKRLAEHRQELLAEESCLGCARAMLTWKLPLPDMPTKYLVGKFALDRKEKRQKKLEEWLQEVLNLPWVQSNANPKVHKRVKEFLGPQCSSAHNGVPVTERERRQAQPNELSVNDDEGPQLRISAEFRLFRNLLQEYSVPASVLPENLVADLAQTPPDTNGASLLRSSTTEL